MNDREMTRLAHVVATIDATAGSGSILYVNPSNVRSGATPAADRDGETSLVLRDAAGAEIGRVHPEIRYDACAAPGEQCLGLIQQDVELPDGVTEIALMQGGEVLDRFRPDEPPPTGDIAADLTLGPPRAGGSRRAFGAQVEPRKGVTYLIQARADNDPDWHTISIGRPSPEFQIDGNQFPGAVSVAVRVIQNAGFWRRIVDERTIPLG